MRSHLTMRPRALHEHATRTRSRADETEGVGSGVGRTSLPSGSLGLAGSSVTESSSAWAASTSAAINRVAGHQRTAADKVAGSATSLTETDQDAADRFNRIISGATENPRPTRPQDASHNPGGNTLNPGDLRPMRPEFTRPPHLFRVDQRPPEQIFANGMESKGSKHPDGPDYNLADHIKGGSERLGRTGYISTSGTPQISNYFAQSHHADSKLGPDPDGGRIQQSYPRRSGWVYVMDTPNNVVHVPSQRLTENDRNQFGWQDEWSAVHRIDTQNIVGAYQIDGHYRSDPYQPGLMHYHPDHYRTNNDPAGRFVANPNYVPGHAGYHPNTDPGSGWSPAPALPANEDGGTA